jgi:hypothetical protein
MISTEVMHAGRKYRVWSDGRCAVCVECWTECRWYRGASNADGQRLFPKTVWPTPGSDAPPPRVVEVATLAGVTIERKHRSSRKH